MNWGFCMKAIVINKDGKELTDEELKHTNITIKEYYDNINMVRKRIDNIN